MNKKQRGFNIVLILLVLAVVGIVALVGWNVWQQVNNKSTQEPPTTISQGVKGTITLRSGDCMPTIAPAHNSCSVATYIEPSKVIIKKSTDLNNKENKEVVKEIDGVKGTFETELQPGLYNMYVLF